MRTGGRPVHLQVMDRVKIEVTRATAHKISVIAEERGKTPEDVVRLAIRALEYQLETTDRLDRIYEKHEGLMNRLGKGPQGD